MKELRKNISAAELRKEFNTAEKFAEQVIDDSMDSTICVEGTTVNAGIVSQQLRFLTDDTIELLTAESGSD